MARRLTGDGGPPLRWVLVQTAPWGHRMRLPGHHLARWLVRRGHTVAYVSAPVSPWHFLSRGARDDARVRWSQEGPLGRWRHPRLFTFIPRTWLPLTRQFPFDCDAAWNGSELFTRPRAGEILREAGFARTDVLVMQNLQLPHLVRQVHPSFFVHAVEDDIAGFAGMPRTIIRREAQVMADADLVTVTARRLAAKAEAARAEAVHLMPNGVDVALFRRPDLLPPRPGEMPPGPVALYVGALDHWFHEELLADVARRLPHWSFSLVGPPRAPLATLRGLPNVHFHGPRQQEQLAPWFWHADAGIIPFRRIPLIESVCPLKLFEYLAAGLAVVSTPWEEMESLASPAVLESDPARFAAALEAGRESPREARADRVAFAERYDWDAIFAAFLARVRAGLAERGPDW